MSDTSAPAAAPELSPFEIACLRALVGASMLAYSAFVEACRDYGVWDEMMVSFRRVRSSGFVTRNSNLSRAGRAWLVANDVTW